MCRRFINMAIIFDILSYFIRQTSIGQNLDQQNDRGVGGEQHECHDRDLNLLAPDLPKHQWKKK
jgi:hypothetical protein